MLQEFTFKGTIYSKGGRWYWKGKLPNETRRRAIALKPAGQMATPNQNVAKQIMQQIWNDALQLAEGKPQTVKTVRDLINAYTPEIDRLYPKGVSSTRYDVDIAFGLLKPYYSMSVSLFSQVQLTEIREAMVKRADNDDKIKHLCISTVNRRLDRIRRLFEWGVERRYVSEITAYALRHYCKNVDGRTIGVTPTTERECVPLEVLEATLPYLTPTLRAMVRLQFYAGARPSELFRMRSCDIDTSKDEWVYKPFKAKNDWRNRGEEKDSRELTLGKKAQQILITVMSRKGRTEWLFSPQDSDFERRQERRENRKTKMSCGNRAGDCRYGTGNIGTQYTKDSYNRGIHRAIVRANKILREMEMEEIPAWTPYQIRHTAATTVTDNSGDDGIVNAQALLGHKRIKTSQIYAKKKKARAQIAARILDQAVNL